MGEQHPKSGYRHGVHFAKRQKQTKGPKCVGGDHHEIAKYPICQASMLGYKEKDIDTRIAIEMLYSGLMDQCEVAVLVSADKDFLPVIEKLSSHGVKCIHASFPGCGVELSMKCWSRFDLFTKRSRFSRFSCGTE